MCYKGFFATFGLHLKKNEAIRMPIMSLCEKHTLLPRKQRTAIAFDSTGAHDAYEELIGQFVQGPPMKPVSNVFSTDQTITWAVNNNITTNDTNAQIIWDNWDSIGTTGTATHNVTYVSS